MTKFSSFILGCIVMGVYMLCFEFRLDATKQVVAAAPCQHQVDILICDTPTEIMHALDKKDYGKTSFECQTPAKRP